MGLNSAKASRTAAALYLLSIIGFIYLPINTSALLVIYAACFALSVYLQPRFIFYCTLIIYPFAYLIRAGNPESYYLAVLPEVSIFFLIITFIFSPHSTIPKSSTIAALFVLACAVTLINIGHTGSIVSALLIVRQYMLPVLYLIVVMCLINNDEQLVEQGFKYARLAFFIVCILSLLNATQLLTVNPSTNYLYPFLRYEYFLETGDKKQLIARVVFGYEVMRLNSFLGGSYGSAAAILFALGLMSLRRWWKKKQLSEFIFAITFFSVALATFSASIVIPLFFFTLLFVMKRVGIILCVPLLLFLLVFIVSVDFGTIGTIGGYISSTLSKGLFASLGEFDVISLFFGFGPVLASAVYAQRPDNVPIDVGIFSLMLESGIFVFLLFAIPIFSVVLISTRRHFKRAINKNVEFLFLAWVMLFLVHGNITLSTPFFPLFALSIAALFPDMKSGSD